ncbi:phosphotransferase [Actinomadura hibisca]|uniref:phosphotransferase n=1 Tax=Actinomadura hibisca TaxID=68565 RepID=UPI0014714CE5|nr:phosphotransferase [Actinomadura hibisca]
MDLPDDWDDRVRTVLATVSPDLVDARLSPLGAGLDSVALLAETPSGAYVLRLPKEEDGAEGIEREARLLPELSLDLAVPRFAFTAPNPLGPGRFCCYPVVPGESLTPDEWAARGLLEADAPPRQIAAAVEAIHAFPVERARALGVLDRDLRADYADGLAETRAEVAPLLPPDEASALLTAWADYLADDANFTYEPTFTHADLSLDHLLVTGDRISGLIDFGDIEIGDPDYDLCYLWAEAGPAFVRRVQKHRGRALTPRQEAKLRFWALAELALDVAHGIENDLPTLRDDSLAELRALLRSGRAAPR